MALNEVEHKTMALEQSWWKYAAAKETVIREQFGESATRYYQRLNALIDREDAEAEYPLLVRRLRRLRESRRVERSRRRAPVGV